MHTPARILRAECDDIPGQRPHLSFKDQDTRDRILDCAQRLMAHHGRAALRLSEFALAMRMAPQTIRRHFTDMDSVLAHILRRHLQAIVRALGDVAHTTPDRARAQRAAYLAATRTPFGAPTEAHLLLIRDRHLLPADEREPLEALRLTIGDILAPDHPRAALALLDLPELGAPDIEAALAAITRPHEPQTATPSRAQPHLPAPARDTSPADPPPPRRPDRPLRPDLNAAKRPPMGPH